jgi:ABC-2 type transport system ATP-binding protein
MVMSIFHPDSGGSRCSANPTPTTGQGPLGYLPEEKGLYKKMKTAEIVAYFGKLKGMDRSTANRARELLTRYGLGDWLDKKCEAMSKGMGQKVQVLGSIIHDPELVILDEPFSGLDPVNRELMRDTILDMKRQGRTVIFSTHGMEMAEQLCDYVMMIHKRAAVRRHAGRGQAGPRLRHPARLRRRRRSALRAAAGCAARQRRTASTPRSSWSPADPQDALRWLVDHVTDQALRLPRPSLHEIFVRTVGGKTDE